MPTPLRFRLRSMTTALLVGVVALTGACTSARQARSVPAVVHLADADNGRTVTVKVGDRLNIVLASTYWTFVASADGSPLRSDGSPRTSPRFGHCVPGGGCGTVSAAFTAVAPGTVTVVATRTSCGEALACGPGRRNFRVLVKVVSGP